MKYTVIAECIDRRTGERLKPGKPFETEDEQQADHLIRAGCLRRPTEAEARAAQVEAENKRAAEGAAAA